MLTSEKEKCFKVVRNYSNFNWYLTLNQYFDSFDNNGFIFDETYHGNRVQLTKFILQVQLYRNLSFIVGSSNTFNKLRAIYLDYTAHKVEWDSDKLIINNTSIPLLEYSCDIQEMERQQGYIHLFGFDENYKPFMFIKLTVQQSLFDIVHQT
ncbi:MAG: hypothetical protein ACLTDM_07185 [Clostridium butyricum]